MKKSVVSLAVILFGIILVAGCSGKSGAAHDSTDSSEEYRDAPAWVINGGADMEGGLAAVGSAKIGPEGRTFAQKNATDQARNELARQLKVKVRDIIENLSRQIGVGENQSQASGDDQVSPQVSSLSVSGVRKKDLWISPKSTVYSLVVMDSESVRQGVRDTVVKSFKKEEALWQKFQAEQGMQALEEQIQKKFGDSAGEQ